MPLIIAISDLLPLPGVPGPELLGAFLLFAAFRPAHQALTCVCGRRAA